MSDAGPCLVVDGGNSMGQIGAQFATERVIERARGHHRLEPAGEIETSSGVQRVWRVEPQ